MSREIKEWGKGMLNEIKVGISDYKVARIPQVLMTIGLGSCVGIAIYDPKTKIGGLSHIMLPDSSSFKNANKIEKFADLAIPQMVSEIRKETKNQKLIAKIAGGASMFQTANDSYIGSIGERNVAAVERSLKLLNIPLLGIHTGGNMGRTMIVDLNTFAVTVRMVNREIIVL
ncbi:chemotaxis protein CheD [Carnobacterium iners]|uniref:Probable chemoreceptor glutamine deamidase CheD n=1 Tax=Carnobacterium iners TaxID=1073423 RepID=A0A1X7MZM1_9LACT|nr:chemotaxis protein CheD [Carnobacterium iners]SMH30408.1 chemotaxis protein CheD [Carnobacterium iners]